MEPCNLSEICVMICYKFLWRYVMNRFEHVSIPCTLFSVSYRNSFVWKNHKIHHYTMKCLFCELNTTSICQQCFPQQQNLYATTTKTITTTTNNNNTTATAATTTYYYYYYYYYYYTTTVPAFMLTVCIISVRICFLVCCCHIYVLGFFKLCCLDSTFLSISWFLFNLPSVSACNQSYFIVCFFICVCYIVVLSCIDVLVV